MARGSASGERRLAEEDAEPADELPRFLDGVDGVPGEAGADDGDLTPLRQAQDRPGPLSI